MESWIKALMKVFNEVDYPKILIEKVVERIVQQTLPRIGIQAAHIIESENAESKETTYSQVLNFDHEIVLTRIKHNLIATASWAQLVSFRTIDKVRKLEDIYVDLDLYVSRLSDRFDSASSLEKVSGASLFREEGHVIIFGGPGAGKTTFMKKFCLDFQANIGEYMKYTCLLSLRLREIKYPPEDELVDYDIYDMLAAEFGIDIIVREAPKEKSSTRKKQPPKRKSTIQIAKALRKVAVVEFLNTSNAILILDGLDEVPDTSVRNRFISDLNGLSKMVTGSRIIVTSRTGENVVSYDNIGSYEICGLEEYQIQQFIQKWIPNATLAKDLFLKVKNSPFYDTAMRPLVLAQLCAIYVRRKDIPPKPRFIYDYVVQLMLEEWDLERDIRRSSKYAELYLERKKEFLSSIAYVLTTGLKKSYFSDDDLKQIYRHIHTDFNLPAHACSSVVAEIESHTGLLVKSGVSHYVFSHKSIQEYLCAKYMLGMGGLPETDDLRNNPNEIAILISLASKPSTYMSTLSRTMVGLGTDFWPIFIHRLGVEKPDFDESPINMLTILNAVYYCTSRIPNQIETLEQAFLSKILMATNMYHEWYAIERAYSRVRRKDDEVHMSCSSEHEELFGHFPDILKLKRRFYDGIKAVVRDKALSPRI